jgi:hypothetical protein
MKEVQKVWAELAAQEKKSQKQELASDVFGNLKRRYDKANGKVSGIKQEIKTVANHLKSIAKENAEIAREGEQYVKKAKELGFGDAISAYESMIEAAASFEKEWGAIADRIIKASNDI